VEVEVLLLEGKESGAIIVEEAKTQRVSLLVLGQERKRSIWWKLIKRCWTNRWKRRTSGGGEVVDYCIQKAGCMTIAVRRKSRRLGGYLITTKLHKNFWLLA
jgi:nucleotide-binding universal stress UspA family protein